MHAGRIGLGWAHDAISFAYHMFMHSPCIRTLFSIYLLYLNCFETFLIVSLSLPLFLFTLVMSMAPKHKWTLSQNPLRSRASSSSDPPPSHIRFCDEDARKDFSGNFSRQGVHSKRWVICPSMLIQEFYSNMHGFDFSVTLFSTRVRGTRIVATPQLVVDVLHVTRVEHPDYLGCEHLRTVSKDEMISAFCERPANWGNRQFTPCKPFAKGPRFMNMVMTFFLHPLFHYNSITEPRARFLLSLLEHLT